MKFAVFGAGRMGERHILNIAAHPRAELTYVVDPDEKRRTEIAARHGAVPCADPEAALSDASVDAVIIASATNTHVDLIIAAARAGKAILCEKPIDLDMGRVEACAAAIAHLQPRIMIGFQRRFDPTHRAVRQAMIEGEIGTLEVLTIVSRDPSPPPAAYVAVSGGQFHDQMIHDFDLALWLSNATGPVELFAMASNLVDPAIGRLDDSDTAEVLMRFPNGAFCRIDCSRRAVYGYDQRVEAFGSQGMVSSGNLHRTAIKRYTATAAEVRTPLLGDFLQRYLPTYAAELDAFINAIEAGTPLDPDFESGWRALRLADAARESVRTGSKVVLTI